RELWEQSEEARRFGAAISAGFAIELSVGSDEKRPSTGGFFERFAGWLGVERRQAEEQRAITSLPWNVGGSLPSMAQTSPTRALTLAPVYGAVSMIARSIAALPLHGYRKTGPADRVRLPQLPQLFQGPSIQGELTDWLHRLLISLLMH